MGAKRFVDGPAAARADLMLPFFKSISYPLGVWGFIVLTYLVIVGASNAVNLTDGLDGLVIMPVVLVGASLGAFAYVMGSSVYSKYLLFPHIRRGGGIADFLFRDEWSGTRFPLVQHAPRAECSWVMSAHLRSAARLGRSR